MTALQFKQLRLKAGYRTQAEAAEALGITPGALSHYEQGRRPVPEIVVRFMRCLSQVGREQVG